MIRVVMTNDTKCVLKGFYIIQVPCQWYLSEIINNLCNITLLNYCPLESINYYLCVKSSQLELCIESSQYKFPLEWTWTRMKVTKSKNYSVQATHLVLLPQLVFSTRRTRTHMKATKSEVRLSRLIELTQLV